MYKLENNVEWTEDLKNAFKHNITRGKIVYNNGARNVTIDENNGIKEIVLEDSLYVPKAGFIGQATSKKVTLTLLDNQQITNLENKEFTLYIGADYNGNTYYINYGNFIVNEPPENDSTNGTIKVIAYDYMIKFNKIYVDQVAYPCTLKAYLLNICSQAQVELGSESFTNDDFTVINNQFEGKTLREVLQHIGKCAFSWARIGQDNKLYFDFKVNDVNAITETITTNEYKLNAYKRANEYYGPVNKVTYGDSDIQGQEESVKDTQSIIEHGENEFVINDNYFAYTTAKRQELIQGGTVLFGFEYMPISQLDLIGFIYLDCNDYIEVLDLEGNSITSRVFSHTIKYNGIISDSIETEGLSDNEQNYKNNNTTVANNLRTEIIVDRANQKITSVIENVTEQDAKISTLTQTVDELSAKISDVIDITVRAESNFARVELEDINESEPVTIKIHPIAYNITRIYPHDFLFPSDTTYLKRRILRFIRTYEEDEQTLTENIDYEIPEDLLYYDGTHYDEFYLDYDSQTCQVTKRCAYDENGDVYVLDREEVHIFDYPTISLGTGDYVIELYNMEHAYLFARLMATNIYTTQFATKAELNTAITQTSDNINLSVDQKLSRYSTTTEMNSAINLSRSSILSTVSNTYVTQTAYEEETRVIEASLELKVDVDDLISEINASADAIRLSAGRLIIDSGNFQLDEDGNMSCTNANITGTITGSTITGSTLQINEIGGLETYVGGGQMYVKTDGWKNELNSGGFSCVYGSKETLISSDRIFMTSNNYVPSGQYLPDIYMQLTPLSINIQRYEVKTEIGYGHIKISEDNSENIWITNSFIQIEDDDGNKLYIKPHNFFSSNSGYPIQVFYADETSSRGTILGRGVNNFELKNVYVGNTYLEFQDDFFGTSYGINVWQSDKKYKENIEKTNANGIEMINKIPHYSFDWKVDKKNVECGYIAQDMEKVNPDFVTKIEQRDGTYNYQINEQYIIPYITKALQEQYEENQKLKKEIEEIKQYLWREEGNTNE